jgi:plasmanylethanolamine desaturase
VHGSAASSFRPRWLGNYDYPTGHRVFELVSLSALAVFGGTFGWQVAHELMQRFSFPVVLIVATVAVVAYALADLLSGVVHFLFDTAGSPDTPIIGQKFIRPFREHHDDPTAMTRGDFIAVNADNFFVCLPVVVPAFFVIEADHHPYLGLFILALMIAVLITNQIHKWTHVPVAPPFVRWLQARRLILSNDHHDVHHGEPRNRNYCITWGVMDPVLNALLRLRQDPTSLAQS